MVTDEMELRKGLKEKPLGEAPKSNVGEQDRVQERGGWKGKALGHLTEIHLHGA